MSIHPRRIQRQVGLADWATKSADYAAIDGDRFVVTAVATITLPSGDALNREFWLLRQTASGVTINRNGNTINGNSGPTSVTLTSQYVETHFVSLGTGLGWAANNLTIT